MFGWFRKRSTKATISNGAYKRWLRAHRPQIGEDNLLFFRLDEDSQEGLAVLGEAHIIETAQLLDNVKGDREELEEVSRDSIDEFDKMMQHLSKHSEKKKDPLEGMPPAVRDAMRAGPPSMEKIGRNHAMSFMGRPTEMLPEEDEAD